MADNLTICYQGVQRIYRNAVVAYIRARLTIAHGDNAVAKLQQVLGKEWIAVKEAASLTRASGRVTWAHDDFELLGVNHFHNIFAKHFPVLCPNHETLSDAAREAARSDLLGWMRIIKSLRDPLSHPTEADFDDDDVFYVLYCARKVLDFLQLVDASELLRTLGRTPTRLAHLQRAQVAGHTITYLDNAAGEDATALVVYLHGLGLDCRDFYPAMSSRFRSIAPSLPGFHPEDRHTACLSLAEHAKTVGAFIRTKLSLVGPDANLIIVGFSTGADLALLLMESAELTTNRRVGVIALDCNFSRETCFISSELASMDVATPLRVVRRIGRSKFARSNLGAWIAMNSYLVRVFGKLQSNLIPLRSFASEIVERFNHRDPSRFLNRLGVLSLRHLAVDCVFSDTPVHQKLRLSATDLPMGVTIEIEENTGHFDLISNTARLERYVTEMNDLLNAENGG